jgi:hypothetical protein
MAYENQPINFDRRIAELYYYERFGLDALKKQINDDLYFKEVKDFVNYVFDNGWTIKDYIMSCLEEGDDWESFLEYLEDF